MTDGVVLATEKRWNETDNTGNKLDDIESYIEQHWNDEIAEGDYDYKLFLAPFQDTRPDLSSYDTSSMHDALAAARDWIKSNTDIAHYYDSVLVIDNRQYDGGGAAYQATAGDNWPFAYVDKSGGNQICAQEIGHLYGGAHADDKEQAENGCGLDDPNEGGSTFESTEIHHSHMGNYGDWDCNVNHSYTSGSDWYAECTRDCVRTYIDNNNL
jgi:hypothetical protein